MSTWIDETLSFTPLTIAVLTISDTRKPLDDRSGDILVENLQKSGHVLAERAIVRDEIDDIRAQVTKWAIDDSIQIIITTGGTGFTGRDITPEAIEPLFDKRMDGFSTLFHMVSFGTIGSVTVQSRAVAGLINATFVFCLPGSPGACKDAWKGILQGQLDSRQKPSNFVDLMPRLKEHL
ncbi:molybdenum cofactor biosynthesis protein B [Bartonella sp. HY329]|uniref:molybdenum cofactor biosynthesis protein B n=1 Tax=unclassified Bartonella TaxID=2645622 RepID=UPI0021C77D5D|nr:MULTISPECIES: molybdenum cofactor biosynthesis protein B [unclassified Bartonella]UXM95979.1 molybdenum cofactor biosynthesis protein B [Bartonella sp. HY329]UXN10304.1 molybdenum cofactor biosynthesis protein B [Bartonella sp. HY328]